jgi:hypothetical protein
MGNTSLNPFHFGGNKPIDIDVSTFTKKSIAQSVSEGELSSQMLLLSAK